MGELSEVLRLLFYNEAFFAIDFFVEPKNKNTTAAEVMTHALLYNIWGRGVLKVDEMFSCDDLILEVAQRHVLDADCPPSWLFRFNLLASYS